MTEARTALTPELLANYLLRFNGFTPGSWLNESGERDMAKKIETWIVAREMFCGATLSRALSDSGDEKTAGELKKMATECLRFIEEALRDKENGGWYSALSPDCKLVLDSSKQAYTLAFIILGAASSTRAEVVGGIELLRESLQIFYTYFWDADNFMAVEKWNRDWTKLDEYRGVNSNLHIVEALLTASEVVGDIGFDNFDLRSDAAMIIDRVASLAESAEFNCHIPEHFTSIWEAKTDYNLDKPSDKFYPGGFTIGHSLEFVHLMLMFDPEMNEPLAREVFKTATTEGWDDSSKEGGLFYTVDVGGKVIESSKKLWPVAEGYAAAKLLSKTTREAEYLEWCARFAKCLEEGFIATDGVILRELGTKLYPVKPDVYHLLHAL